VGGAEAGGGGRRGGRLRGSGWVGLGWVGGRGGTRPSKSERCQVPTANSVYCTAYRSSSLEQPCLPQEYLVVYICTCVSVIYGMEEQAERHPQHAQHPCQT